MSAQRDPGPPLAFLLLHAGRALDRVLRVELAQAGWPALTGGQSLVFAFVDPDGTPPATLARRLGITRQSTQELVAGLVGTGLLEVVPDPARRTGRLVRLTGRGRRLAADAGALLLRFERDLGPAAQRLRHDLRLLAEATPDGSLPGGSGLGDRAGAAGATERPSPGGA